MGYFIRFFGSDAPPTIQELQVAVADTPSHIAGMPSLLAFGNDPGSKEGRSICQLWHPGKSGEMEQLAVLEINAQGDELFREEIGEFLEYLEDGNGQVSEVKDFLRTSTFIVAVQCLFGDRDMNEVLDKLSPVLTVLKQRYTGLSQADGEGFYRGEELIVELN